MSLFELEKIQIKIKELENKTLQNGFWEDSKKSSLILHEIKSLKNKCDSFYKLENEVENLLDLNNLLLEQQDIELENEFISNINLLENELEKFEIETLLSRKI